MIKTERELTEYIKNKHKELFPFFHKVEFNTVIQGYWSNKKMGYADLTFKYHRRWFVCEIKYDLLEKDEMNTSLFWDSLKVVGYEEALSLVYKERFYPIIMIPKSIVSNDVLTIIGKLNINYVLVSTNAKQEFLFDVFT